MPVVSTVLDVDGNVIVVLSVPDRAMELFAVSVFPSAIVSVALVAGAVIATLLMLVAEATPSVGVVSVGLVANTRDPDPVSSDTAAARLALDGVAKNVATPDPRPDIPVDTGRPEQFVRVPALGVPILGVVRDGDVANTSAPDPVSSVTAAARLDDDGVARNVATPVPSPDTPVEIGSPVQLVSVPALGVPKFGVVNAGDVVMATLPEPDIVYSPSTPLLLNSTRVLVPLVMVVEPMVSPPPAAGAAHVPSPRQNVDADAPVPLLRFPTGRFPVTPFDRSICAHAGLFDVPVFDRYRVAVVFFASTASVLAAEA